MLWLRCITSRSFAGYQIMKRNIFRYNHEMLRGDFHKKLSEETRLPEMRCNSINSQHIVVP